MSTQDLVHNTGYFGSLKVIEIDSQNEIKMESPACVAAPRVTMVALNRIELGVLGQNNQPVPVRFFVPEKLSISANEIIIGKVNFLCKPAIAAISCTKLTLVKFEEEEPVWFEAIKRWLTNNQTIIQIIRK